MIDIKDLCKTLNGQKVLNCLNLFVPEGETLVILGRSGVGKSILLKHILGLMKPDQGMIEIAGTRIEHLNKDELYKVIQNMGMLFQGCALFDSLSIEENTAFYLTHHPNPKTGKPYSISEIKAHVDHALSLVNLSGTQKKKPNELSGGMRKRAALARLIVYRPKILLYDEPTTGLDPVTAEQINELIIKVQKELNATSIAVTHDISSALTIADSLAFQHDGKIIYNKPRKDFLKIQDPVVQDFLSHQFQEGEHS